jgi:hypothetical protein
MSLYLQYHNVASEGLPLSDPPFSETRLGIHTRRPHVEQAEGRVFLVSGLGGPRHFYLWETFEVEEVRQNADGEFEAGGTGWQLAHQAMLKIPVSPHRETGGAERPVPLRGKKFKKCCMNRGKG